MDKRSVEKKELEKLLVEIDSSIAEKVSEYKYLRKIYDECNPFAPIIVDKDGDNYEGDT